MVLHLQRILGAFHGCTLRFKKYARAKSGGIEDEMDVEGNVIISGRRSKKMEKKKKKKKKKKTAVKTIRPPRLNHESRAA